MPSSTASDFHYHNNMKRLLHAVAYPTVPQLFVALMNTVPNSANVGGQEVGTAGGTGGGYARVPVATTTAKWTVSGTTYQNTDEIAFQQPTSNWNQVNGACIYDAATGGNMLFFANLTTPKTISQGDGAPRILPGQLQFNRATC